MIKVDQTTFGMPGGDCFSACIASILELPLADVPYFMGQTEEEGEEWWGKFEEWALPRGFYPILLNLTTEWRPSGLHVLSGKSPRGNFPHSLVASGKGEIIHDPHPSRDGIDSRDDVVLLIPFDPAEKATRILRAILEADERGQGLPFAEAMQAAKNLVER
ncbi:hypothetical protein LCGC14_2903880 [marine sediment metagenome]|uniref:Peptidase C39-like domain-containing protein n=1 Tax=marine sediment metagenome TaxID=412755 RepID=A0A0F8XU42_9ZZZZ